MKLGITGFPLTYTQSPRLHAGFMRKAGVRGSYDVLPFDPKKGKRAFFAFLDKLAGEGYLGLNVTIPLKEWAYEFASRRGGAASGFHGKCARAVEAANTLVFTRAGARCANTDSFGLWSDLSAWLGLEKKGLGSKNTYDLLVVGTGGSARGALAGVASRHAATRQVYNVAVAGRAKAKVRVLESLLPRARRVSKKTGARVLVLWCLPPLVGAEARCVWENLAEWIGDRDAYLYDLNYGERAEPTRKLVPARRRRTGEGMLLAQARCSFELWSACRPTSRSGQ